MSINFSILKQAGVSYEEFGALCNVSKIAVYKWTKGGGVDKRHSDKIAKLVKAVEKAVDNKLLPLQHGTARVERVQKITEALVKALRKE